MYDILGVAVNYDAIKQSTACASDCWNVRYQANFLKQFTTLIGNLCD